MSRRTNGTNRAGAAIGVNIYTGKLAPRKKKNLTAATVQVQELRKISYPHYKGIQEENQDGRKNDIGAI